MGRLEQDYREALDGLRFSDAGKERIMKNLMEQQAGQPVKRKRFRPLRTALIAAAVCLALVGTAVAASPGLREMMSAALGSFAPYAKEQGGEPYVINGIEFRVKSVLADDFTVRAYVEARDLEGDRLSKLVPNETGAVFGLVDVPRKDMGNSEGMGGFTMGGACLGYDAETKTALLSVTSWGQVMADDLSGSEVKLFDLNAGPGRQTLWENTEGMAFPVEVKPIPSLIADSGLASALQAEEVRISNLGLSVIFQGDAAWPQFAGANVSAKLADGTLVEAPWEGGQGSYGAYGTETSRKVLVWNFRQPVDADSIQGICMGEDYFPIR